MSGDIDTTKSKVMVDLGNSDRIGKVEFALQNKDGTYKSELVSGNATVQVDIIQNSVVKTVFRGTLEQLDNEIDYRRGTTAHLIGYDYAQELLGLISPDARQQSALNSNGTVSLTSGEQGMGSQNGMDLAFFTSGTVGSGTTAPPSFLGVAARFDLFLSQFYGKSGDTTGTNSGTAFSFKPYLSGMTTWGTNPTYRTWYAQDGGSDTNANYWIPYDSLKTKHEYAWDVLRKLTRQGMVVDRSGFKAQFEVYVGVSGDINLLTSGTSNFISSGVLVYYQAGNSGSANNNILDAKVPFDTTTLKSEIVGWFPIWSVYPDADIWSDIVAYSGGYWSGTNPTQGSIALSGGVAAPGSPGMISIYGRNAGNSGAVAGGFTLLFTLWSGYALNIKRWNVSGGTGVILNYQAQPSSTLSSLANVTPKKSIGIYDTSGNFIASSGVSLDNNLVLQSGWTLLNEIIYNASGLFNSGIFSYGASVASASGVPDLSRVKRLEFGFSLNTPAGSLSNDVIAYAIDNVNFQFSYNYNPVVAFNSGSISAYGRRYEVFEFPYQVTDSGAGAVVLSELQGKSQSRQLASFTVKDNPNLYPAQLNITPGQVFIVDAPSLNTGSGQTFYYWRATEVKHEWSHHGGFLTYIKAYPWISGGSAQSGQNLISYSLPLPAPVPRVNQQMPITTPYGSEGQSRGKF